MNRAQHQVIKNNINANYDIRYFSDEMKREYMISFADTFNLPISNAYLGRDGTGQHAEVSIQMEFKYPRKLTIEIILHK
jgi:hypothetical protein